MAGSSSHLAPGVTAAPDLGGTFDLTGAPAEYQLPVTRPSLEEARQWCHTLTTTHYENFHVATFLLPKRFRGHFDSLYAYCRVSDDLGDEVADPATALRLLTTWGDLLDECYDAPERSRHPVFVALRETIAECELPRALFHDLLAAFKLDQTKTRFASIAELEAYSHDSANPVGRLVLWICGYREERVARLSDKVCTALQLANFWQDVVEDWEERGRRYLPADLMERFGVTDEQVAARRFDAKFRALMEHLVTETRTMLREGGAISQHVDRELAATLDLFRAGGDAILDAIAAQGYDTLTSRPEVSKGRKARLLAGALWGKIAGGFGGAKTAGTPGAGK
jgi:squalene synthase HpnC